MTAATMAGLMQRDGSAWSTVCLSCNQRTPSASTKTMALVEARWHAEWHERTAREAPAEVSWFTQTCQFGHHAKCPDEWVDVEGARGQCGCDCHPNQKSVLPALQLSEAPSQLTSVSGVADEDLGTQSAAAWQRDGGPIPHNPLKESSQMNTSIINAIAQTTTAIGAVISPDSDFSRIREQAFTMPATDHAPCSMTWCAGHDVDDADWETTSFDELVHVSTSIEVENAELSRVDTSVLSLRRAIEEDGARALYVDLNVVGAVTLAEAPSLITALERYIDALREHAAQLAASLR